MNRKKTPLFLTISWISALALLCIGTMFLTVASVADRDLFDSITKPIISYTGKKFEDLSLGIVAFQEKAGEKAQETQEYMSEKAQETQEYLAEKAQERQEAFNQYLESKKPQPEEEPDSQALGEATLSSPREIADFSITHFQEEGHLELLTGGTHELIYFNQTDEHWGNYGYDSVSGYGCGPTSMAMVYSTLTGHYMDAQEMADIFVEEQFWASKSGTYYSFAYGSGERFNLKVEPLIPEETTASLLLQHLMSGKLAIALMGPGHFTNAGHFIVLRGSTLTGDVLVADPASRERSLTTWDPQLILDELSPVRSSGAPLWLFSVQQEIYEDTLEEEHPPEIPDST